MFTQYISCPLLLSKIPSISELKLHNFLVYLEDKGYAAGTVHIYLSAIVHFESWRQDQLTTPVLDLYQQIADFLKQHLLNCNCPRSFSKHKASVRASLKHWLPIAYPMLIKSIDQPVHTKLVDTYNHFLINVTGLSLSTRQVHCRHALAFLRWFGASQSTSIKQLSSRHLTDYILMVSSTKTPITVGVIVTTLKSFTHFLASKNYCTAGVGHSLPRPKIIHSIPSTRALNEDELNRLLLAFDRTNPVGKRDYAMARCLIDMGIRTSDVAQLSLDHIHWRSNTVILGPGKSRQQRSLPMPAITVNALIDYLRHARPETPERKLFVHHRAPVGHAVLSSTVRQALRRAFKRAGFKDEESQVHRLRHAMATRLLQQKNPLKIIADVLGHRSVNTTIRYTHVDRPMLSAVAMPWPGREKS